jgi:hypothetical protein
MMENFLLLLYKCVLYDLRTKGQPNLRYFQLKLIEYEKLEYVIAEKN